MSWSEAGFALTACKLLDAALPAWSGDLRAGRAATRLLMESCRDTGGKQ
jgi:hypothetical protein